MCMLMGTHTHACLNVTMEARGQLSGVGSVLPPCGLWRSKPGHQAWQQLPISLVLAFNLVLMLLVFVRSGLGHGIKRTEALQCHRAAAEKHRANFSFGLPL